MSRACRNAAYMQCPYRPWIVWDEEEGALLVVARTESQARRVWREYMGLSTADYEPEDIHVRRAEWERATPEPRSPQRPCVWNSRSAQFGYGLREEDHLELEGAQP